LETLTKQPVVVRNVDDTDLIPVGSSVTNALLVNFRRCDMLDFCFLSKFRESLIYVMIYILDECNASRSNESNSSHEQDIFKSLSSPG